MEKFVEFQKIARLSREMVITEKLDGTNAGIYIGEDGEFATSSRTRWITPEDDNAGFSRWAYANKEMIMRLGAGMHYGEWWGLGIQRGYGLKEKRFSLFNVSRWEDPATRPDCVGCVPVLYRGMFDTEVINEVLHYLSDTGSKASEGFMNPEGIVIYHTASGQLFKKTIEHDDVPKSLVK